MLETSNFFWATLIGLTPHLFLVVSIGSGLEKIIEQNLEAPSVTDLIYFTRYLHTIIAFWILLIAQLFLEKYFIKNNMVLPPSIELEIILTMTCYAI